MPRNLTSHLEQNDGLIMKINLKQTTANQNYADAVNEASNDGLMEITTLHYASHNLLAQANVMLHQANTMLKQAVSLITIGQYGAAMKLAYEASEFIAAAYLSIATGQSQQPSYATYDLFDKMMRKPSTQQPVLSPEMSGIVGCVSVLREVYEPALLDETSAQDAQQMIEHVSALLELVSDLVEKT
jgi:HEPN domain-containing protein